LAPKKGEEGWLVDKLGGARVYVLTLYKKIGHRGKRCEKGKKGDWKKGTRNWPLNGKFES